MKLSNFLKIVGIVTVINILSRGIGFFREIVIGFQLGTTFLADSVIMAYTLPSLMYFVVGGAVTTSFISIYAKVNNNQDQQTLLQTIFTILAIVMTIITLVFMFFSKGILAIFFTGLKGEELAITTNLFLIMAPASIFLVLSMWFAGILNVNGKYALATFSTLLMNSIFVLLAIVLFPQIGYYSHGVGATISAIGMFSILVYSIKKEKLFNFKFGLTFNSHFFKMLKLFIPIFLGGATLQFYFLLHRVFASHLSDGFVAALNYSSKVVQLPQAVLMTAVTTVIYPLLAKKVAQGKTEDVYNLYQKGMKLLFLIIVPFSIFIIFYSESLVNIIFQYGNFTEESSKMTVPLLQVLAIATFAHAANMYVTRFFYAMEKSILPVLLSVFSVFGVNVGLSIFLVRDFGAIGLAWATTISAYVNLILLVAAAIYVLKFKLVSSGIYIRILQLLALVVGYAIILAILSAVTSSLSHFLTVAISFITSSILYLLLMRLFKLKEAVDFQEKIKGKIL